MGKNVDDQLVTALSTGMGPTAAAKACGVSRSTVNRRLGEERFQVRLAQARAEALEMVLGKFTALMEQAVMAVTEALGDEAPIRVRLAAAKMLLDVRSQLAESVDRDRRLGAIEKRLGMAEEAKR